MTSSNGAATDAEVVRRFIQATYPQATRPYIAALEARCFLPATFKLAPTDNRVYGRPQETGYRVFEQKRDAE